MSYMKKKLTGRTKTPKTESSSRYPNLGAVERNEITMGVKRLKSDFHEHRVFIPHMSREDEAKLREDLKEQGVKMIYYRDDGILYMTNE